MAVNNQSLGPMGVPLYTDASTLALEVGQIPVGQIACIQTPPMFVIATQAPPASGFSVCTSTSSAVYGSVVTYWLPIQAPSEVGGQAAPNTARVSALALAAYSGSGTGTLTASANGLIGSSGAIDGVTVANGDQIFVQAGLTNVTSKDSGPWTVVSVGSASTKYVLSRPWWFATGNKTVSGQRITVGGEGTFFANTVWRSTAASVVIDATDPAFYVEVFTFQRTLVAGTLALAAGQPTLAATSATCPVGILSLSGSTCFVTASAHGGTLTGTVSYAATNASSTQMFTTLGYVGTSAMAVFAIATAYATQTGDTSTVNVTIINFG